MNDVYSPANTHEARNATANIANPPATHKTYDAGGDAVKSDGTTASAASSSQPTAARVATRRHRLTGSASVNGAVPIACSRSRPPIPNRKQNTMNVVRATPNRAAYQPYAHDAPVAAMPNRNRPRLSSHALCQSIVRSPAAR